LHSTAGLAGLICPTGPENVEKTEDGHQGQVYEVTGPRLLTFADAVAALAEASGRDLRFESVPIG
jgi:uncharacterized protein YbjT (DUF2867 family)